MARVKIEIGSLRKYSIANGLSGVLNLILEAAVTSSKIISRLVTYCTLRLQRTQGHRSAFGSTNLLKARVVNMVGTFTSMESIRAAVERRELRSKARVDTIIQSKTERVDPNGDPLMGGRASFSKEPEKFYDLLRHSTLGGLNLAPVVGGLMSYLGALFIPNRGESPETMWRRLIKDAVSEALLRKVERDLIGLSNVAREYSTAVATGNQQTILAQSIAANTVFAVMLPGFQLRGEESALLPLFSIAATLHLALVRDMVLKGKDIGMSDAHVARLADQMIGQITQYSTYVDTHVAAAIDKARRDNPNGSVWQRRNMPLSAMLETKARYQITVVDFRDTWRGFDPVRFPGKSSIKLDREVYTPILGWWDSKSRTPDVIPSWKPPQSPLKTLKVWDKNQWRTRFIFGFESEYADGSTLPSGSRVDTVYSIPAEPYIDEVVTQSSKGVFHMSFRSQGRWKGVGEADRHELARHFRSAYSGHRLSSVRSVGKGDGAAEGAVSGCVLGFQLIQQEANSISLAAFDVIASKVAPQLVEWIAE
jgi:hypothetical protein